MVREGLAEKSGKDGNRQPDEADLQPKPCPPSHVDGPLRDDRACFVCPYFIGHTRGEFPNRGKKPIDRGEARRVSRREINRASGAIALQQNITQADRVLGKFGDDLQAIADALGWPYKRLWNWKRNGLIPQEWHQPLLDSAVRLAADLHPYDFVAHLHRPAAGARDLQSAAG